ncbi:DUF1569 domain-containing protein [Paludisphaera borealis]|uniref:DinB-like domain-containing protein n=1 Tax=Paludisphaera borealis TaxID=1387353 RepID=A0A1U7CXP3_9BACT|nr:DUF1569 domain-containing protein [Paludisphaera borealis]APW63717.1 hypothetical protein BSF38_05291 [Paludisphaera borealis]
MPEHRTLNFDGLDGVMPEVERLLAAHETIGRWTLGQILYHLAVAVRLSMEGKPNAEPVDGRDPLRAHRRLFFRAGRFPENTHPPLAILIPPDSCDPNEQAEALREAIRRFENGDGPFASHPMLGAMSKTEWAKFHGLHCAHHLGFVVSRPIADGLSSDVS